ncbi:ankyrin repeat domain-containing protein [Piscinibacter sp. HJYY11]|uniref:ankyrin repeat domain-containing protein n=1 Tax=Piscinibacter sp. HJYY11 TaxID=2801333 RepID=UPI00191FD26C|nr:ankyrin repeat domain-containing protein [Piscinibacter sp. HJYY11]MBL0728584.1 ankyrin repeat domain-containing protein [Piscinibacter sp. HJYY11]
MSAGDWKDLYQAAVTGNLALVKYHISEGVNPNYQHPEILCTPLVASLIYGHAEVARYLLENGANPNLLSEMDSMTPLQAARRHGRDELVPALLAKGAEEPRRAFWRRG